MICINCFHENTLVTNSRDRKKQPSVWRRRHCIHCKKTFTTYEKPSLSDAMVVIDRNGQQTAFNLGKLLLSIARGFSHAPEQAEQNALPLAETVEATLYALRRELSVNDIVHTTHTVLKRFDELAALQYGAQHQLISSVRRRGRPSLASHEPPTPPSPSR